MSPSARPPRRVVQITRFVALGAALTLFIGCPAGDQQAADTGRAADSPAAGGAGAFTEASITPQMVALGDSIFHGRAANGLCHTCHGQAGAGSQLGPNLTDQQWIHGDGSLSFIENIIRTGVPQPQQFPTSPMPPQGPPLLTDQQVRAAAAYVYSLTHPNVRGGGS